MKERTFVEVRRPPAPIIFFPCLTINPQLIHLVGGLIFFFFLGIAGSEQSRGSTGKVITPPTFLHLQRPESQAAVVTSAVTDTQTHATVLQLLYSPRVCDKSLRACHSQRAQRCTSSPGCKRPVCLRRTTWPARSQGARIKQDTF